LCRIVKVLDCFTVGGAGGYSVHVYEIQCNGELGHWSRELPDVIFKSIEQKRMGKEGTNTTRNITAIQSSKLVYELSLVVFVCEC